MARIRTGYAEKRYKNTYIQTEVAPMRKKWERYKEKASLIRTAQRERKKCKAVPITGRGGP
jgi:hypothetical protein